jgi:hypothetical protein
MTVAVPPSTPRRCVVVRVVVAADHVPDGLLEAFLIWHLTQAAAFASIGSGAITPSGVTTKTERWELF